MGTQNVMKNAKDWELKEKEEPLRKSKPKNNEIRLTHW